MAKFIARKANGCLMVFFLLLLGTGCAVLDPCREFYDTWVKTDDAQTTLKINPDRTGALINTYGGYSEEHFTFTRDARYPDSIIAHPTNDTNDTKIGIRFRLVNDGQMLAGYFFNLDTRQDTSVPNPLLGGTVSETGVFRRSSPAPRR